MSTTLKMLKSPLFGTFLGLDCILDENIIHSDSIVLDYGCGKGRVSIYLSYKTKCKAIGIEYDYALYSIAMKNNTLHTVSFIHMDACHYIVDDDITIFYFFNPFSMKVFRTVIHHILESYYRNNRKMYLIFYYPQDDYISYMNALDDYILYEIIDTNPIFHSNDLKEAIYIYTNLEEL